MDKPIGIFDSGLGGLTVFSAFKKLFPDERIIYFGDTARVPYGTKSQRTIQQFALQDAQLLMQYDVKAIVIACNTASALALNTVIEHFDIPVIGVIEPGALTAVSLSKTGRIGVIGTGATIRSGMYERIIKQENPQAYVRSIACPLFVSLVEENWINKKATRLIAEEYLQPFHEEDIDVLVLGCTHYPLLTEVIQDIMGPSVTLVDSAQSCAEKTQEILTIGQKGQVHQMHNACEQDIFLVSDMPEKFKTLAARFLGERINSVSVVDIEQELITENTQIKEQKNSSIVQM